MAAPIATDKLRIAADPDRSGQDAGKLPVVLLGCGSFNPPHHVHIRMFELSKAYLESSGEYEVLGAYLSPVSDGYKKAGLLPANHRVAMCRLAANASDLVMVDDWEASQNSWTRTLDVLRSVETRLSDALGGTQATRAKVMIVCGSDLVETFRVPNLWAVEDMRTLAFDQGIVCLARGGAEVSLPLPPSLQEEANSSPPRFFVVSNDILNDLSSTKIRDALRAGEPEEGLLEQGIHPDVMAYISKHELYRA